MQMSANSRSGGIWTTPARNCAHTRALSITRARPSSHTIPCLPDLWLPIGAPTSSSLPVPHSPREPLATTPDASPPFMLSTP
ncbi:hypothetical protein AXF42_Ash006244 [Apostasia shenzhenica]|uniref:Uncharacterized protein n=1 Tax=Apostasia shenzhenica TaxID=1088818 RepID=A0A2I0AYI1_9ASPA|nr:hypothetical protein AXF42_Ash006244 [Apostasia shenzhenica]